ncbi:MAG: hypothetical protein PHE02_05905 [Lachnospiraceae bacterium]|nr:hypothetical protein [Lachnospiraceae bacterium]
MSKLSDESLGGTIMETHTNPALGVIGAIIGALLGAVLWVVLYQIGIIASVAGIAIVFCACKGYALLSKSEKLGGVVTAIVISVVVLVATVFLCWSMDIYNELNVEYEITLLDAFLLVPEIAFTADFIVKFVKELLIGLILIGVGAMPFLRQVIHYDKNIK